MIKKRSIASFFLLLLLCYSCDDDESMDPVISNDPPETELELQTIDVDGVQRKYLLYVPPAYDENSATPVLFNFHDYTVTAEQQMTTIADMRSLADEENFILVYPQGAKLEGITHWNVGAWTTGSTSDDVGFVDALIDELAADYNIDQDRVYACGHSNGGSLSYELACQLSDRIAAIGAVAATMTEDTRDACNPTRPIAIISLHGDEDNIVSFYGAYPKDCMSQGEVIFYWSEHNNTNDYISQTIVSPYREVKYRQYLNGDNGTRVEQYRLIGQGHGWPSSSPDNEMGSFIDANQVIWDFVSQFELQ